MLGADVRFVRLGKARLLFYCHLFTISHLMHSDSTLCIHAVLGHLVDLGDYKTTSAELFLHLLNDRISKSVPFSIENFKMSTWLI